MRSARHGSRATVRWNAMHGRKIIHHWWLGAWWHMMRLRIRYPGDAKRFVYVCHWGQWYHEGEIFRRHYHVGRRPTRIR